MALDQPAAKTTLTDVLGPKFNIVTKALTGGVDESGKRRFRATASSTITDLAGDEITLPALEKMAQKFRQGLTIFMDHDFQHVDSAFGLTDGAEIIQRGVDGKGTPIWDLDISGVVNTPNPRAVQLSDSIDGGFVKLGASVTAFVREHARKKQGGMLISDLDVIEASVVGIPENQRSWAQKAALAIKSFDFNKETTVTKDATTDETHATDEEAPVVVAGEAGVETVVEPEAVTEAATTTCPECGQSRETTGCSNGYHAEGETSAESATGVQESASETPETTPEGSDAEADTPLEKAASFDPNDVAELVHKSADLVGEIGRLREENARLLLEIDATKQANLAVSKEVDLATEIIGKVMQQPLRAKTAGFVADFQKSHALFDPDVADYLNKRERTTVK